MDLLRAYHDEGSEAAFAELVRRHIDLVYSAAWRQVGNPSHAEEITQAVFVVLAKKAGSLRANTVLEGWLHTTTRLTALSFLRGEYRRQRREQEAYMQSALDTTTSDPEWNQLAPLLDDAIARLGKRDREAIVLRFFKNKSLAEVAAVLQTTEMTAQSRVHRAVRKLQKFFLKHGINSTAEAIVGNISARAVIVAPAMLAGMTTAMALAKGATASTSTATLINGALKLMAWTKVKTAIVVTVGIVLAISTATVIVKPVLFPVLKDVYFEANYRHFQNLPAGIEALRPTHFQTPADGLNYSAETSGKAGEHVTWTMDRNASFRQLIAHAYNAQGTYVILPPNAPTGHFDYLSTVLDDRLDDRRRQLIKKQLGYVASWKDDVATEALVFKVRTPGIAEFKSANPQSRSRVLQNQNNQIQFQNWPMGGVAAYIEGMANVPVIDQTGITDRFNFALDCGPGELADHNWDAVNQALERVGLELVPTNLPLRMLVVEKAK